MLFKYKAIKPTGETFETQGDFADRFALYKELKNQGVTVVSVAEAHERLQVIHHFADLISRVSLRDKIIFARNLGTMLEAGLSVSRTLSILEQETESKVFKATIKGVSESISKGQELSASLAAYPAVFSSLFISMVKAGEQSGTIDESLKLVASQMNDSYELQKKVRGAMMYPAIIVALIIAIAILMLIFVIPSLTATFKELNVALPLPTRIVLGTSSFFTSHYVMMIIGFLLLATGLFFGLRTRQGQRIKDYTVLHIPIIKGIVIEVNAARTARTFASLITSGVDIVKALEITSDVVQNSYYREILDEAKNEVQKGNPISAVFSKNTKLYPVFVGEMISVGEETGKLGEMLGGVASFYEKEVDQKTKNLSTVIEPVLMVLIGAAVGLFAISVISPIYSLVNNI